MTTSRRICVRPDRVGAAVLVAFLLVGWVLPVTAQCSVTTCTEQSNRGEYIKSFGFNVLLGGLAAGFIQVSNGGNFFRGFQAGVVGGGLVFAGKAVAGRDFNAAGLMGRQLAGVGNSLVANAAANRPLLSSFIVYPGPLPGRLIVSRDAGFSVRPVVDLISAGAFVYGSFASYLDWGASFSNGAAVFRAAPNRFPRTPIAVQPDRFIRGATTVGGAIFITARGEEFYEELVRHEMIHVLQIDAFVASVGDPSDTWLFANYPGFDRIVKVNWLTGLLGGANQTLFALSDRSGLPWEVEARLFSGN